jgi:small GTP-binding protein
MIRKKVCLLGAFAVGKTSLVARFVKSIYSVQYHTTVGVKVDKKTVEIEGREINLIIWDLAGKDEFQKLELAYLCGLSGYLLVADGTRRSTLEIARGIQQRVSEMIAPSPFLLLLNKSDMTEEWEIDDQTIAGLENTGWRVIKTSARTGQGVEEAFTSLARKILDN